MLRLLASHSFLSPSCVFLEQGWARGLIHRLDWSCLFNLLVGYEQGIQFAPKTGIHADIADHANITSGSVVSNALLWIVVRRILAGVQERALGNRSPSELIESVAAFTSDCELILRGSR